MPLSSRKYRSFVTSDCFFTDGLASAEEILSVVILFSHVKRNVLYRLLIDLHNLLHCYCERKSDNCKKICIYERRYVLYEKHPPKVGVQQNDSLNQKGTTKSMDKLAIYLKQVREKLKLSTRDVAEEAKRKYPHNKQRQISFPYLNRMESGKVKEFSPLKLKTLAEVYGENYLYLLYLAGILPEQHIKIDSPLSELEKLVYDELLESGLLRNAAKSKTMAKIDPKTRTALRQAVRIAARAALETILNSE